MPQPKLRITSGTIDSRRERELDRITGSADPRLVSIPLRTMVPLLIDAVESNRAWLNDFSDELVRIDSDLYDVLLAYSELGKRQSA